MSSFNATFMSLISNAQSCGCSVNVTVGQGTSNSGKPKALVARFKLPVPCLTEGEVLAALRKLGSSLITINLPKLECSDTMSVSLRPVMSARVLADTLSPVEVQAQDEAKANGQKIRV